MQGNPKASKARQAQAKEIIASVQNGERGWQKGAAVFLAKPVSKITDDANNLNIKCEKNINSVPETLHVLRTPMKIGVTVGQLLTKPPSGLVVQTTSHYRNTERSFESFGFIEATVPYDGEITGKCQLPDGTWIDSTVKDHTKK